MVPLGQTGGQKLGRQLRETTETSSTKPLTPLQDDHQAGMSSLTRHERELAPPSYTYYLWIHIFTNSRSQ